MKLYTGYDDGSIPTELLKSYIEKKLFYHKIFYTLNSYDHEGTGFIKENNLKLFFINQEELTTVFNKVEKCNLTYFYISHLCAYTLFMLDPLKIRSVNITDIMRCTLLDKLYQLKKPNSVNDINNWLTFKYVNEHYEQFKIITQGTFVMNSFALGSLAYFKANKAFLARFDEISLNGTEGNDYERYVNLIMAYHSLSNVQSLKYFFDILDTNNDGYVCEWDIKYFYKENQALYKNCQKFEDFVNEIFDIVINNSPSMRKFTLLDLIECRQGDFIIKTLIDTDSFKEFQSLDI
uniref:Serine/threonine-protein phosphatase 2A regulatory subunit B'' subunit gamma (Trinotate prediction) n=1 Tax=Henneguya salminicola TaxID=69463 RepID=A0A6G3MGT4_HENSL